MRGIGMVRANPRPAESMDLTLLLSNLAHLLGAFALALPIGWERQTSSRSAGLRTFPLVAAASCAYMLLGMGIAGANADASSRVLQGLLAGIGFIGGGAILKSERRVRGTATAASLWMTGALGVAVALGRWELAVSMTVVTFVTLWVLTRFEQRNGQGPDRGDASDTMS